MISPAKQAVNDGGLAIAGPFCQAAGMAHRFSLALLAVLAAVACAAGQARAAGAKTYLIDPVHTQIVFFADHLGFSHGIGRVRVREGWFRFDAADWSSARADIVVDVASLDMGEPGWSEKVRSAQFLDTARWPTARFIGNALERKTANTGILHGALWLRGVRRDVDLEVTFNREGGDPYAFKEKAGFTARAQLDRFDFGMTTYRDVVGATVELRIEVEGILSRAKPAEARSDAAEE